MMNDEEKIDENIHFEIKNFDESKEKILNEKF